MRAILPGRPQSKRQALCTAQWDGLRLVAYVSGNTAIVLRDSSTILQTISIDHVESLSAITIDESCGRIALCNEERVLVFDAIGRDEDDLRWTQAHDIPITTKNEKVRSLSWGSSEELLVGGTRLWLYHLPYSEDPRLIWEQAVANEIALAYFSPGTELIASCGQYDKLVKIWRRLSFEVDSTRFDVSYLPHPAAVTDIRWRKPWHNEQSLDTLLYTVCSDNQVRVWTYSDPHSLSIVQLIATIDTNSSIEPRRRSIGSVSRKRFVFMLDSRDFSHATEKAIQQSQNKQVDHALEHLVEIANRSPELCVVLDGLGHMSVWGLENAGCKNKKPTVVFNVTLVDEVHLQLSFPQGEKDDFTNFCVFSGGPNPASLCILVHSYTGQIDWYESSITHFFDTASRENRVRLMSSFSGHDLAIDHIARGSRGDRMMSWTDEGQAILWSQSQTGALRRKCEVDIDRTSLGVILLDDISHLLILHPDAISMWDMSHAYGVRIAVSTFNTGVAPVSFQRIGTKPYHSVVAYFVLRFENGQQEVWCAHLTTQARQSNSINGAGIPLRKVCDFVPVDIGDCTVVSCDNTENTLASNEQPLEAYHVLLNDCGHIKVMNATFNTASGAVEQIEMWNLETNVLDSGLARANTSGLLALTTSDRKGLSIWNLHQAVCEWRYEYNGTDQIQKLAWVSSPRSNLFLFVGFSYHALIIGQFRYSVISARQSAWYVTQNISLRDFTNAHVGDVCWLSSGDLAVGAGNQMFLLENVVTEQDSPIIKRSQQLVNKKSASAVIDMANSTLPVFHAAFLEASVMEHGLEPAERILRVLYEKLKFYVDGDEIASDLDLPLSRLIPIGQGTPYEKKGYTNGLMEDDINLETFEDSFMEYLNMTDLWQIGPKKKQNIATLFVNLIKIGRLRKSLDENALRYLYAFYNTPDDQDLDWRAFTFASRSTSHEALLDIITRHHNEKLTWTVARRAGLFVWLEDVTALQTQLENVGRAEFTKFEDRNPVACSLYYLALNKKTVLTSLWRMSFGLREKENTMKLLANNFDEPRWKQTALKNAYALLSKRRFEYGAAFFLLGGSLKDAVNVCVNQLNDIQLAIAITRVWDRDVKQSAEVLQDLMYRTVLVRAIDNEQGRWMAAWAYSVLDQPIKALQSLVRPLHQVVGKNLEDFDGPVKSMSFRANDPHLNILYRQIRQTIFKQKEWTVSVLTQREEWNFVLRSANWWTRAGMDLLALQLVQRWEFLAHQEPRPSIAPTTLTAPATEELNMSGSTAMHGRDNAKKEEKDKDKDNKKKPPPTQFFEPSADSLLDSFGF